MATALLLLGLRLVVSTDVCSLGQCCLRDCDCSACTRMSASSEHQLRPSSFSSQDTLETHTLKVSKMTWTLVFRLPSVASSIEERLKVGGSMADKGKPPNCRLDLSLDTPLGGRRGVLHCGANPVFDRFPCFCRIGVAVHALQLGHVRPAGGRRHAGHLRQRLSSRCHF